MTKTVGADGKARTTTQTRKARRSVDDFEAEQKAKAKAIAGRAEEPQGHRAAEQVHEAAQDLAPTGLRFFVRRGDRIVAAFLRRDHANNWARDQSLGYGGHHEVLRGSDFLTLETYDTGELVVPAALSA